MIHYKEINRSDSINRMVPDLFNYKTVLYIGARTGRIDFGPEFQKANYQITVIEIFKPNVDFLKTLPWLNEVRHCDIRTAVIPDKFDVVFWWHGPEHVHENELEPTLNKLESVANKLVVLGCPWGICEIGPIYNNPNEEHISHFDYTVFEELGYNTECLGEKNVPGSNITSIKRIGE